MIGYQAGGIASWTTAINTGHGWRTNAAIAAKFVHTSAAIGARIALTFIDVELATFACKTLTLANRADISFFTDASMKTRIWTAVPEK